jgi:hypothetical protein
MSAKPAVQLRPELQLPDANFEFALAGWTADIDPFAPEVFPHPPRRLSLASKSIRGIGAQRLANGQPSFRTERTFAPSAAQPVNEPLGVTLHDPSGAQRGMLCSADWFQMSEAWKRAG